MGILEITQDEAKSAHKSFYDGDFEIMPMKRLTYYHFFPINLLDVLSDLFGEGSFMIGSWKALISTDGHKVVITRLKRSLKGYFLEDLRKVGRTYEFKVDDIISTKFISFQHDPRVIINLNKKVKGVSFPGLSYLTKLVLLPIQAVTLPLFIGLFIPNFFKKPQIKVILNDQFKNKERFKSLLEKL